MIPGIHRPIPTAEWLARMEVKHTSDDTFTPPNVYEAVVRWVFDRYNLAEDTEVVRPFWPGADYREAGYPDGAVVIDNPPFSILAGIVRFYRERGIRFFLFAPYTTNIGVGGTDCGHILAPVDILYANGASVPTSFVTNLDPEVVAESAPDLREALAEADAINRGEARKALPKYDYPAEVITSTALGRLAKHGIAYRVHRGEAAFIRRLDAQVDGDKTIFGGALLVSRDAADRRRAVSADLPRTAGGREWVLSDRERGIVESLGGS